MTALTADRYTLEKEGDYRSIPCAAGVLFYAGALIMVNSSGYAVLATAAIGLTAVGRNEYQVDNTQGAAGALSVKVRRGIFNWNNSSGADAITNANIGAVVYAVDDQTVALTNGTNTRSAVGRVYQVDADGVWVETL